MKKSTLFLLTALIVILASCKKEDNPDPIVSDPVITTFPFFKLNATWTYDAYDSDDPSTVISVVYKIIALDAQGYGTVSWTVGGYTAPTMEWYADNTKFSKLCSKGTGKMLVYCTANPSVGDLWTESWSTGTGTIIDSVRVLALNETVVVPAGTFTNCIKLHETTNDDPVYYTDYWFSKTHGIIKSESTTEADFPTILYEELRSY